MGSRCSVCSHPNRTAIDVALTTNSATHETIARAHGLSRPAVSRHKVNHLSKALTRANDLAATLNAGTILTEAIHVHERAKALLDRAETCLESGPKGITATAAALREVRSTVELLARMAVAMGQDADEATVDRTDLDSQIANALRERLADRKAVTSGTDGTDDDIPEAEIVTEGST